MFAHGETWTILRPGAPTTDRNGNEIPGPDVEIAVDGCGFVPGGSVESDEYGRSQVITSPRVFMPAGTDVGADDRLRSPAGVVFAVEGRPKVWRSPFSGWDAGVEVSLEDVTG